MSGHLIFFTTKFSESDRVLHLFLGKKLCICWGDQVYKAISMIRFRVLDPNKINEKQTTLHVPLNNAVTPPSLYSNKGIYGNMQGGQFFSDSSIIPSKYP